MDIRSLKENLINEYKYRIELHAHTSGASACSQITPEEMAKIYHSLGYDGIVITNHFTYRDDRDKNEYIKKYINDYEIAKQVGEDLGLTVLLGTEIRFAENANDYLIYGVDESVLSSIYGLLPYGVENFRRELKLEDSVFLQAHPFRDGMQVVDSKLLDGIEIYNMHPGHNSRVGLASRFARDNSISIVTAGTDFHNPGRDGLAALRCRDIPKNSFDVASVLKSGDYLLEIAKNNIIIP